MGTLNELLDGVVLSKDEKPLPLAPASRWLGIAETNALAELEHGQDYETRGGQTFITINAFRYLANRAGGAKAETVKAYFDNYFRSFIKRIETHAQITID